MTPSFALRSCTNRVIFTPEPPLCKTPIFRKPLILKDCVNAKLFEWLADGDGVKRIRDLMPDWKRVSQRWGARSAHHNYVLGFAIRSTQLTRAMNSRSES